MKKGSVFFGGMLVMVLAFGMTIVGCGDGIFYAKVKNGTNFDITLVVFEDGGKVVESDPSGIKPGETKTYELGDNTPHTIKVTLTVGLENVEITSNNVWGGNSWSAEEKGAKNLVVSGTSKETLKISSN